MAITWKKLFLYFLIGLIHREVQPKRLHLKEISLASVGCTTSQASMTATLPIQRRIWKEVLESKKSKRKMINWNRKWPLKWAKVWKHICLKIWGQLLLMVALSASIWTVLEILTVEWTFSNQSWRSQACWACEKDNRYTLTSSNRSKNVYDFIILLIFSLFL